MICGDSYLKIALNLTPADIVSFKHIPITLFVIELCKSVL
jgi:hypothetical protein